jgi:hypothetical protein
MEKATIKINEKLKASCEDARATFTKLNLKEFKDIQGRLQWCIGSYEFDKNAVGLNEYGKKALRALKAFKKDNPKKVTKKVIAALEKATLAYARN